MNRTGFRLCKTADSGSQGCQGKIRIRTGQVQVFQAIGVEQAFLGNGLVGIAAGKLRGSVGAQDNERKMIPKRFDDCGTIIGQGGTGSADHHPWPARGFGKSQSAIGPLPARPCRNGQWRAGDEPGPPPAVRFGFPVTQKTGPPPFRAKFLHQDGGPQYIHVLPHQGHDSPRSGQDETSGAGLPPSAAWRMVRILSSVSCHSVAGWEPSTMPAPAKICKCLPQARADRMPTANSAAAPVIHPTGPGIPPPLAGFPLQDQVPGRFSRMAVHSRGGMKAFQGIQNMVPVTQLSPGAG